MFVTTIPVVKSEPPISWCFKKKTVTKKIFFVYTYAPYVFVVQRELIIKKLAEELLRIRKYNFKTSEVIV